VYFIGNYGLASLKAANRKRKKFFLFFLFFSFFFIFIFIFLFCPQRERCCVRGRVGGVELCFLGEGLSGGSGVVLVMKKIFC
jgi:hypothetical protein